MAISTNGVILTRLAGALYNQQLSNATYNEVLSAFNSPSALNTLANYLISTDFASKTDLQIATTLVTNLGLTAVTGLDNWIAAQLTAAGSASKGSKIISMLNDFSNMSMTDATYGAAVTAFNTKIDVSQALSQTTGNAGGTFTATGTTDKTFTLTTGVDSIGSFTGGAGNDTFVGSTSAGAVTFGALDALDGGAGTDSLTINAAAAFDTANAVGATVKNIENIVITSSGAVTATTTAWTGVTSLTTASTGDSTLTTATTTDIAATVASPTTGAVINGGKAVTLTLSDTATTAVASGNVTTVGVTTPAVGAVTVSQNETFSDVVGTDAGKTSGSIRVDGGTAVAISSLVTAGTGSNAADVATIGAIAVNGKGTATSVSVTQSAQTAAWAATGDKIKVTNGGVTIIDNNTATKADTITSVTLNNFGASTIQGNALTTVNLTGGSSSGNASGTLGISQSAGLTAGAPTTLALNMTSGQVGVITDTNGQYTTLNIASAAASTIAGLAFTNATTLAVSGAGVTTVSAQTDLAKVTSITSSGGGLSLTGTLGTAVAFTGGAGKETITVGATTKAIATGAGDDNITVAATALGTGGSIDAGDGSDTLTMAAADAATASASNTFATKLSNFEKLAVGITAATATVNTNLLGLNTDVSVAGVSAGQVLTLAGLASGAKVSFAAATQTATTAALLNDGTADSLTVALTGSNAATTVATLTTTGFETVNFTTANTATTPTAQAHVVTTLTDANAKTITVTGNAGLTLGTFSGTSLTSFDASGVTLGGVSYTTGVLTAGATLTGGAGADTLNAAASTATAGVTIIGGAGADTITGSATRASTLNGGADNDTITGGAAADTIDGGTGTNTYVFSSANVAEQAGTSTTSGVVINLGSTTLTQSAVNTATSLFLATVAPTVASGTSTYLFSAESSTDVSIVDTLANIQNVVGSNLADYIVGSDAANVITGGLGNDVLTGGAGIDTFQMVTLVNNGTDRITDFTKGTSGDIFAISIAATGISALKNGNSAAVAAAATVGVRDMGAATTLVAADNIIVLTGATFANAAAVQTAIEAGGTRVLTFGSATTANDDIIVVWSDGTLGHISTVNIASGATTITATNATVADFATLTGITSIAAGDFVAGNFAFIG